MRIISIYRLDNEPNKRKGIGGNELPGWMTPQGVSSFIERSSETIKRIVSGDTVVGEIQRRAAAKIRAEKSSAGFPGSN